MRLRTPKTSSKQKHMITNSTCFKNLSNLTPNQLKMLKSQIDNPMCKWTYKAQGKNLNLPSD